MDIEKAIEFQKNCGKIYCADPKEVASIFNCTIQALEEYEQYRKIGTLEELKHIKTLYEKVDFERLSKLSQEEDIEALTVNVRFYYNQLLNRDEAVALLIENVINIFDKEAKYGHSESD